MTRFAFAFVFTLAMLSPPAAAQDEVPADRCEASCHCPTVTARVVCEPSVAVPPPTEAPTDAPVIVDPSVVPLDPSLAPEGQYQLQLQPNAQQRLVELEIEDFKDQARRAKRKRNWGLSLLAASVLSAGTGTALIIRENRNYDWTSDEWFSTRGVAGGFLIGAVAPALFVTGIVLASVGGGKRRRAERRIKKLEGMRWEFGVNGTGVKVGASF